MTDKDAIGTEVYDKTIDLFLGVLAILDEDSRRAYHVQLIDLMIEASE